MAIKGKTVERNLSFEISYRGMGLRALARPKRNESSKAGFDFREFKHHASQMDSKKSYFLELTFIIDTIFFHIMRLINN